MTQQIIKEEELLKQLIGEWQVGIAMKTSEERVITGCGEMAAVDKGASINIEINARIEGHDDYYENDIWSFNPEKRQIHLFNITPEGEIRDHVGKWKDDTFLELKWRGGFEDQENEEIIHAKWVTKDQIEIRKTHYTHGKKLMITDYVFKRKESTQAI